MPISQISYGSAADPEHLLLIERWAESWGADVLVLRTAPHLKRNVNQRVTVAIRSGIGGRPLPGVEGPVMRDDYVSDTDLRWKAATSREAHARAAAALAKLPQTPAEVWARAA